VPLCPSLRSDDSRREQLVVEMSSTWRHDQALSAAGNRATPFRSPGKTLRDRNPRGGEVRSLANLSPPHHTEQTKAGGITVQRHRSEGDRYVHF
jgi:hypothetical protein